MKLRHVRAVAVFGIAVIALTGARGSHGGGCDNSGSSSSSSSNSDGSTGSTTGDVGKDDDYDYDDTTTTTGGTGTSGYSGSSGSTGGTGSNRAVKDVKIETCELDAARGIVARVRATNSSASTTYTYEFRVTFRDSEGSLVRTSDSTIPYVTAGSSDTLDVAAAYVPADGQDVSGITCRLSAVTRAAE